MSDSLPEKQKHGRKFANWDAYLALFFGILACVLLFACTAPTAHFPTVPDLLFYQLAVLTHSPSLSLSLLSGLCVLAFFVGTVILARWRRANLIMVIFAALIGVGLLGVTFVVNVFTPKVVPQQTLIHQDHIYHLVVVWDNGGLIRDFPIKSYTVIQCDEAGWLCGLYATPYTREYQSFDDKVDTQFEKFYPNDELFIDEVDQTLKLRVGDEIYPVIIQDEASG